MTRQLLLHNGDVALVDDEDYATVSGFHWRMATNGRVAYAQMCVVRSGVKYTLRMHNLLMNPPAGLVVDHINGSGLDNRRKNLRLATQSQNTANSRIKRAQYRGVYPRPSGSFEAKIVNRPNFHFLGTFATATEAAQAYDAAAKRIYGEFARLNFPEAA